MSSQTRRKFLASAGAAAVSGLAGVRGRGAEPGAFRPRFAICNETFKDWPFEKAFDLAAECGYQGVEIAPFTISNYVTDVPAGRRREIRRQLDRAGLEMVGLHWLLARTEGLHLTSPDAAVRKKTAKYLGDLAEFCAELGGNLLVFGSPKQRNLLPGVDRAKGMELAAEVIESVMPTLEASDVVLAMEPLSPGATDFLNTAAEAVELVKRVDSPRCRMILDCNAMSTESTPMPELIRRSRAHLAHFHANDPNQQGPGFGKLDFLPILSALRAIDYRGWVSVEVFNYAPGPERLARENIEYMRKCVAEIR
ncbi:MAG: sugar phosphate isomerase/epimerase [Planctomycetes bacterium]|nr:sugar phosphate isomerase/epimerase [Planctomycetota bacterium]